MRENIFNNKPKEWLEGFNSNFEDRNPYGNPDIHGPKGITQQFEDWREGRNTCWFALENHIGQIIYENEAGSNGIEDYEKLYGRHKKEWIELEQWTQDDYEWQASKILQFLIKFNLINIDQLRSLIKESLK